MMTMCHLIRNVVMHRIRTRGRRQAVFTGYCLASFAMGQTESINYTYVRSARAHAKLDASTSVELEAKLWGKRAFTTSPSFSLFP